MKDAATKRLDEAVKDGQADRRRRRRRSLADVDARLDDIVNGTPPDAPGGPEARWR